MVEALVRKSPIAIIGSGSIGVAWAIVFARAGHPVAVQDTDIGRLEVAKGDLSSRLAALESFNLIDEPPHTIAARVRWCRDLAESVAEAELVLEAVPENLEIKRIVFSALDVAAPAECVLASSSSAIAASQFAGHLPSRARVLVIHPGNPPYLIRVVELVPAPFTEPAIVDRAEAILSGAGMVPVRVRKEVEGFVFNRLQGAVLREAYCLVRDGVASVEDIDSVMREGLGPRWSIIGPFETVDLNTRGGIEAHAKRLGPAYARMGAERGQNDPWTDDLVAKVSAERRAKLPLSAWEERVAWRDRKLMAMAKIRVSTDEP
ncbi:3-hydroxyacyl-CoA dehydrogenase [Microvirga antarctica]|uniref:3-hydroxyacyl-CoA dehydrogenase n=1 Tax=Microvirga antarctica TaxID=2819233 RepID=UPI001B3080E6|nr:3-hydroxyacyl-CoA dehydrogenase [Microvirga antarctica]